MASFDEVIPPGQVGKVTAQLHTDNYRGPVEKVITVTSTDPINPAVTLRFKANIVGSVQILPRPGLSFPAGMAWDYSGKVLIRKDQTEKGELKLTDVATNVPWLTAKARKVEKIEPPVDGLPDAEPGDYVLEVAVSDDAPQVAGGYPVTFKTGLEREPEMTLPVSVVLQTPMRVMPSPLFLPQPQDESKGTAATLSVALRPGLGKQPLTATVSPDSFTVSLEPDGPRKYKANVVWKPAGPDTPTKGNVVFRVGEESQTVLVRIGNGLRPAAAKPTPDKSGAPAAPSAPGAPGGEGHP